ncbi:MAG: cytidylate kinase-like family protein [Desulfobacter sp.]|nr:MAG: cytidylate kinase-like family protein [Desulfobacter sp.]
MTRSIHQIIDEQIKRWEMAKHTSPERIDTCRVITISRECGSRGHEVAQKLAEKIGFDLFHNEILEAMIQSSQTTKNLLETLDEKAMNVVDDIVSNFVNEHHLWPDEYSKLLLKILNTVGRHGNAVILGRGANFALEKIHALKIRIVAPEKIRREYIQRNRDMNADNAWKYMNSTDANRIAFVKRYFNADAANPENYDMVLNTGTLSVDKTVATICCAIQ